MYTISLLNTRGHACGSLRVDSISLVKAVVIYCNENYFQRGQEVRYSECYDLEQKIHHCVSGTVRSLRVFKNVYCHYV